MCKEDLILSNLQWLIYHKTKPNQRKVKSVWETGTKRGWEMILNSYVTNRLGMPKDFSLNPWEYNYLLSPYITIVSFTKYDYKRTFMAFGGQ